MVVHSLKEFLEKYKANDLFTMVVFKDHLFRREGDYYQSRDGGGIVEFYPDGDLVAQRHYSGSPVNFYYGGGDISSLIGEAMAVFLEKIIVMPSEGDTFWELVFYDMDPLHLAALKIGYINKNKDVVNVMDYLHNDSNDERMREFVVDNIFNNFMIIRNL